MEDFWDETLETGLEAIDRQHRKIMDDLKEIHSAATSHGPRPVILAAVSALRGDCEHHFTEEDRLMVSYDYPATEPHLRQHEIFLGKIEEFRISFDTSRPESMSRDILEMRDWFRAHIEEYDRLYMEHIYV